jgi:hypothetical protein
MTQSTEERNRAVVFEAFDLLFNRRDYAAAGNVGRLANIQHSAHSASGR